MPKRRHSDDESDDKLEYLKWKIKKLQRKLDHQDRSKNTKHSDRSRSHRRHTRTRDRSVTPRRYDDDTEEMTGEKLTGSSNDLSPEKTSDENTADDVHTEELIGDEEVDLVLLDILGTDPSTTVLYGKKIHEELASRLHHVATSGLTKEARKELVEKYPLPENCDKIGAPSMNPEIKAAITEVVLKRDRGIEVRQKQLASAISALAQLINTEIDNKDKDSMKSKQMMDICRILCDIPHAESVTRRNFATFSIKKELKEHLKSTKIDKTLFGENLAETLKAAKAITKSGSELKTKPPPKPTSSASTKNWKSPAPAARKQQQYPPRGSRNPPPPPAPGPAAARMYHNAAQSKSSKPSPHQSRQPRRQ